MQLIAKSGSECLQQSDTYPKQSINDLAINSVSLKDKYHLENMQILAKFPKLGKYLYEIMTNSEFINGKYYRNEINALINAKSFVKATAIYHYIVNPKNNLSTDFDKVSQLLKGLDVDDYDIMRIKCNHQVRGNKNPNYSKYLELLNNIDDRYVLFIETLLANEVFINSKYCDYDINSLLSTQNTETFMDLYKYLNFDAFLVSPYHINDLELISKATDDYIGRLLISRSLKFNYDHDNTSHHDYDMLYISKLDYDNIDDKVFELMHYYLFDEQGINHPEHIERLDLLSKGETNFNQISISNHLTYLENNPDALNNKTNNEEPKKEEVKKKTLFNKLFGKNKKH